MDKWTPAQRAEWNARWHKTAPGSQERVLLEDMEWTGEYEPLAQGTPPQSPLAQEPRPSVPLPPKFEPSLDLSKGIATGRTRRDIGRLGPGSGSGRKKTYKAKKGGEIVSVFFNIREQVKLYHWQTKSFSEHKTTDELVGKLDANIDMFVETYMGRYGRPYVKKTLPVKNLTVTGIRAFITRNDEWLSNKLPRMIKKTDSDLLNIRDEILADLNQVKYLFTLA